MSQQSSSTGWTGASLPKSQRNLIACRICGLVKTFSQFSDDGCDNCVQYPFHEAYFRGKIMMEEATTAQFVGSYCMMCPEKSWAGRYQGTSHHKAGVYAVKVEEQPGPNLQDELVQNNIIWVNKPDMMT